MERQFGDVKVVIVSGDIAEQIGVGAVVNAANAQLLPGGGVAGALHRAAGPGLAKECRPLAPICPGQAVITTAHNLPNNHVIHCLGPVYGRDEPSAKLLSDCYRNALKLAEKHGVKSVAFPSISTGVFGYPLSEAAGIALETVAEVACGLKEVKMVKFVLFDKAALQIHEEALRTVERYNKGF